ncbi:transporter substrate-binding domain-containing protein, partial [Oenococcus oeni]
NGLQLKIPSNKIGNAGYYGFAVKKGKNEALLKAFNRGLASIKKDGTYDKIVKKYLGESQKKISSNSASTENSSSIWYLLKQNWPSFVNGVIETIKLTVVGIILASIWGILMRVLGVAESKILRTFSNII